MQGGSLTLTLTHLALWRGVLFTDESRFSLYRADGRQSVWRSVQVQVKITLVVPNGAIRCAADSII